MRRLGQYDERVKWCVLAFFLGLAACGSAPKPLVYPELAEYMPPGSVALAGIDLDRLRTTPFFAKLPDPFREGSYALIGYAGAELVVASRVGSRVVVSGRAVRGNPPALLQYASAAPIWIVARGDAALPLTGNLTNLTRLLQQTEYTTVTAQVGERVDLAIRGVCRTPDGAQHLEDNARAIASLMKLPLDVRRDGAIVHATGSISTDAAAKLF